MLPSRRRTSPEPLEELRSAVRLSLKLLIHLAARVLPGAVIGKASDAEERALLPALLNLPDHLLDLLVAVLIELLFGRLDLA